MENIRKICSSIAKTADLQEIKQLAKILAETFNVRSVKSIGDCDDLLYWLYIDDQKESCFDLCNAICQIRFSADIPVFDYLISIHVLHIRLLQEKRLTDQAECCKNGVIACYVNRPNILTSILEGSSLYYKEIEATREDTEIDLEKFWKLCQYKCLCFICGLGGSELLPKERAEKEMNEVKSSLLELSQIVDKLKQERTYSGLMEKGASEEEIKKLCDTFSTVKLPSEFIDFYKIHNGQIPYTRGIIDNFYELLPIDQILDEWSVWKDLVLDDDFENSSSPDPGIANYWYHLLWIPIASNGCGDVYCLDLDPTPEGTYGQIISVVHDDSIRSIEALSFTSFLENTLGEDYLKKMR